jgi:hypothetical protein
VGLILGVCIAAALVNEGTAQATAMVVAVLNGLSMRKLRAAELGRLAAYTPESRNEPKSKATGSRPRDVVPASRSSRDRASHSWLTPHLRGNIGGKIQIVQCVHCVQIRARVGR